MQLSVSYSRIETKRYARRVFRGTPAATIQIRQQIDALKRISVMRTAHGARPQRLGATVVVVVVPLLSVAGLTAVSKDALLLQRTPRVLMDRFLLLRFLLY
jgi:hypothetical protein